MCAHKYELLFPIDMNGNGYEMIFVLYNIHLMNNEYSKCIDFDLFSMLTYIVYKIDIKTARIH